MTSGANADKKCKFFSLGGPFIKSVQSEDILM